MHSFIIPRQMFAVIYYTNTGDKRKEIFTSERNLRNGVRRIEREGGTLYRMMQSARINWKDMNIHG